jgi:hypothetical protein
VPFAASNHLVTHNQTYFDKINSKTPNKPKQNQTTHLLRQCPNNRQHVTHRRTHWQRWVTMSGQTTPVTSSFPAKPNWKTLKNTNSTSKIDSNASKIDSNTSKIDSNASKINSNDSKLFFFIQI